MLGVLFTVIRWVLLEDKENTTCQAISSHSVNLLLVCFELWKRDNFNWLDAISECRRAPAPQHYGQLIIAVSYEVYSRILPKLTYTTKRGS